VTEEPNFDSTGEGKGKRRGEKAKGAPKLQNGKNAPYKSSPGPGRGGTNTVKEKMGRRQGE